MAGASVSSRSRRPAGRSRAGSGTGGARLVGLDVARCLALLGMIATHVLESRTASGDLTVSHLLASGRASALFAVLAGVSVALVSGRATPVTGRDRARVSAAIVVRALVIGAIGLVLGGLGTGVAVILCYYAVLFVLGLPFLGLRGPALVALAVGWAVAAPPLSYVVRPELPARQYASPAPDQLADSGRLISELLFTGYYPAVPWLAYLLLGMGLGRLDLSSVKVAARLVVGGLVTAVAATLVSGLLTEGRISERGIDTVATGLYGQTPLSGGRWLLVVVPHSTTPFDLLQTGGSACLVIGACLLLVRLIGSVAGGERIVTVVFGAGTMTLSLYCLHVLMLTEPVPPPEEPGSFVWHVLVVLWIGAITVALGRRGPLEAGLAGITRAVRGR